MFAALLVRRLLLASLAGFVVSAAAAQPAVPRFEEAACPFQADGESEAVRCGYLVVAENRAVAGGRTLRLAVAVLGSLTEPVRPDPLVFLSGGPGGGSVEYMPRRMDHPFWNRFRQDRDLVFFDQRGTGFSEPRFCLELDVALYTASFRGLSVEEQRAFERNAVLDCREKMLADGIDFSAYNSAASARDLDELRQALGYDRWNLFGASYGTRLALTAMRDTPGGIRSVVLDSVSPPNSPLADDSDRFMRSLSLVFSECAADERCQAAFPALESDFFEAVAALEADPVVLDMSGDDRFPGGRIVIDGTLFSAGVFQGLYDQNFVPFLPLLVKEVKARNESVLFALADSLVEDPHYLRQGLRFAVDCYELIPFAAPAALAEDRSRHPRLAAFQELSDEQAICDAWHAERADSHERQAVASDIPALIATGAFDPITPPSYARLASQSLPNSTLFESPVAGHGVAPYSDCAQGIMHAFLDDPGSPVDTGCIASLRRADFVTAVHANPGIYRLVRQLEHPPAPAAAVLQGVMFLLIVSALFVWPIAWLGRRFSRGGAEMPKYARVAVRLEFLTMVLILAFLGGLAWAIVAAMNRSYYLPAVGVPEAAAPLFLLPWLIGLLALALAVLAVMAWTRRWPGVTRRVYYTAVAAACLGFVLWAAGLGLLPL